MSRTPITLQPLRRPQLSNYICKPCRQSRAISQTFLAKKAEAKAQWEGWAREIRAGTRTSMLSFLEERGYVHDIAGGRDALDTLMIDKRIGAYVGIDPTASSLHVGHLLPLMTLFWMYLNGFQTITLVRTPPEVAY